MPKSIQPDGTYTCIECGEMLNGTHLIEHLKVFYSLFLIKFSF